MTPYRFRLLSARLLFLLVAFAVLTFGGVERWATAVIQVAVFLLAAAWAVRRVIVPFRFVWNWLYVPLGVVVLVAAAQYWFGWTAYRYQTASEAVKWLAYLGFFALCCNVFCDRWIRNGFSLALTWFAFGVAVFGLVQFYTAPGTLYWVQPAVSQLVFGPFPDRNHFAVFMELTIPGALVLALRESEKKWIYFVVCGLMLASVVVCASRAGAVVVAAELVIIFTVTLWARRGDLSLGTTRKTVLELAALALVVVGLTLAAGMDRLQSRFEEKIGFDDNRAQVAAATWEMFQNRPLTGYGLGTFQNVFVAFRPFDDGFTWHHAHNDPLQLAMELGVWGLVVQGAVIVLLVWRKLPQRVWLGNVLPVAGAWAHSWTEFPIQIPGLVLVCLALLAQIPPWGQTEKVRERRRRASSRYRKKTGGVEP